MTIVTAMAMTVTIATPIIAVIATATAGSPRIATSCAMR